MNQVQNIRDHLLSALAGGDMLLIVPPVVTTRTSIVGPHILQAVARQRGYTVDVLYLDLLLASIIGVERYESISYGQPFRMLGERLFARSAYGLPPLGKSPELCDNPARSIFGNGQPAVVDIFEYKYYVRPASASECRFCSYGPPAHRNDYDGHDR